MINWWLLLLLLLLLLFFHRVWIIMKRIDRITITPKRICCLWAQQTQQNYCWPLKHFSRSKQWYRFRWWKSWWNNRIDHYEIVSIENRLHLKLKAFDEAKIFGWFTIATMKKNSFRNLYHTRWLKSMIWSVQFSDHDLTERERERDNIGRSNDSLSNKIYFRGSFFFSISIEKLSHHIAPLSHSAHISKEKQELFSSSLHYRPDLQRTLGS